MKSLVWQGNSREMVNAIINGTPVFFRRNVEDSINRYIRQNRIETVTEELVFKAVDDIAPEYLAKQIKGELEKMKTNK